LIQRAYADARACAFTVEVPESFFEATTDDYKVALQAIKASRMRMEEETQMRTKEMKEKDRLRKIPKYRKVMSRAFAFLCRSSTNLT
jgi:hypothetical protein